VIQDCVGSADGFVDESFGPVAKFERAFAGGVQEFAGEVRVVIAPVGDGISVKLGAPVICAMGAPSAR
jgi:hypothetical protein